MSSNLKELIAANARYADDFGEKGGLTIPPARQIAILTCMDARLDPMGLAGLKVGDAHIIRNAGGVITDDVIRSLCLSQRFLGTREILLVHHSDCGLQKVDESAFRDEMNAELGVKPWWSLEAFDDPYDDVRQSMQRLQLTPFIAHKEYIRGFVYDVTDGLLHEVAADGSVDLPGGAEDRAEDGRPGS